MTVFDCVTDRRIDPAYDEGMLDYDGLIVHIAVSNAFWPSYKPGTKAHFYARKDGSLGQEIDTRFQSGAQLNGNGRYLSVELQGGLDAGDLHAPMPQAQLETLGRLLAEANQRHGIPLRLMVDTRPNSESSRGLGYHRLGVPYRGVYATRTLSRVESGWLQRSGDLWFSKSQGKECPGDGRISQIPQILALAKGGAAGALIPPTTQENFLMALSDAQQQHIYDALVVNQGGFYYKTDALINILRGETAPAIASLAAGNISFPGNPSWNAIVTLVNVMREKNGQAPLPVEVDEAELAKSLAPLLAQHVTALSDADVQRLVAASADESDRRALARLKG